MARANVAILFALIGLASATAQCYVAYSSSTAGYHVAETYVLSVTLQNGTKPSAAVSTGFNATFGLNFVNSTHIAQYRQVSSSYNSGVEAVLFDVTTMKTAVTIDLTPAHGFHNLENHEGLTVTATNDGAMFWAVAAGHSSDHEAVIFYTYSEATGKTVLFDEVPIHINITSLILSGSDVPRISGVEVFGPYHWAATYTPGGQVTSNVTLEGIIPIPDGAGDCRAFVMDQTTGETQFMCNYLQQTKTGNLPSMVVISASTLTQSGPLKTIYTVLNEEFSDFYNDGTQWYILDAQGSNGQAEWFYIYTLSNDMQQTAKYGPYHLPPVDGLVYSLSFGALSCSSS